ASGASRGAARSTVRASRSSRSRASLKPPHRTRRALDLDAHIARRVVDRFDDARVRDAIVVVAGEDAAMMQMRSPREDVDRTSDLGVIAVDEDHVRPLA